MMRGYDWDMSWMWLFGPLVLVGLALLVVLAVRLFSGGMSRGAGPSREKSRARQILDERFAKGELTTEQYREQTQVLDEGP